MKTNQGEKIIIVKENREGCFLQTLNAGCALIFAIIGLAVLGSCYGVYRLSESKAERPSTPSERLDDKSHLAEPTRAIAQPSTRIEAKAVAPSKTASIENQTEPAKTETTIDCSKCQGTGKIKTFSKCSKCGGAGRIYTNGKWQQCPKRIEQSPVTCSSCNGTGKITQLK